MNNNILQKAKKIKLLLTDNDGVLTDAGVYYSPRGEEMKRFSIRDGMGVARLRDLANVETGIISGENSPPLKLRAKRLKIIELHLGINDKLAILEDILLRRNLQTHEIAYIGDDSNDLDIMKVVGLSACPSDAMPFVKDKIDYICHLPGGHGAFRELAELIISAKLNNKKAD